VSYRKSLRSQAASEEIKRQREDNEISDPVPSVGVETTSPAPKRQRRQSPLSPAAAGARLPPVASQEPNQHLKLEAVTVVAPTGTQQHNMEAEIQSSKQLVSKLQRDLGLQKAAGNELEDQGFDAGEDTRGIKREKGEGEGVAISSGSGKPRLVKKNKRIQASVVGENTRRMFWTAAIFGLGVTAASLFPQVASQFL
jgi:hypothetical protein